MTGDTSARDRARNRRLVLEWWLVALLSTALIVFIVIDRATARIDNIVYDGFLRWGERAPRSDILIVAIDNRSLAEAGHWPWPRERHAQLIDTLARAHPRAIAYDVLFVEPADAEGDRQLGKAVGEARVFLPLLLRRPGTNGLPFDTIEPIAPLRAAAAAIGHVDLAFDDDGLVRRVEPFTGDERKMWPHLMELMRASAGNDGPVNARAHSGEGSLISYTGPPGNVATVSAAAILRGEVPPEFLKDRLIIVGATANGLGDQYPVPVAGPGGVMPGVEIQANMLDSMLTGRMIRPVATVPLLLASLIPLWLLLLAFMRLPPRSTILLLLALIAVIAGTTAGLLLIFHCWLPPAAALVGLAVIYPLWGWRRLTAISAYMVDELERLRGEPQLIPRAPEKPTGIDMVGRQAWLLQGAITRMDDLRQFVTDRLQQMPDSIFVTDDDGQIVMANREAIQLCAETGVSSTGNIRELLALLTGAKPDELPLSFPPAGSTEHHGERQLADGRSLDLRIVPQQARSGDRIGWIVRVIDVSDAKAAERQREEILRLLSHDMRSPQTSIITALDRAEEGGFSDGLAQRIRSHAERTLQLADGFVQLARAETIDYEMEEVDLGDLIIEAADNLWERSSSRRITVDVGGVSEGVIVTGERSLLTRALINLLDNAIKYSEEGGQVLCRLEQQADTAICTIEDHGIGFPPDQAAHLFEQFRRAPGAVARRIDGAGLGLSFVHTVIARHGGTIRCKSVPSKRTIFSLTLPLSATSQD
jgi:CHASE2 domain-containing sensor protein/signal transduction histidine kinase